MLFDMVQRCVCSYIFACRPNSCVKYLRSGTGKYWIRPSCTRAGFRAFSRTRKSFTWYNKMLDRYPIRTKCITSGVLYGLGDYIAQKATGTQSSVNYKRLLRSVIYGSLIMAPLAHVHFNFLEWLTVSKIVVQASLVPFVKMFFDQFGYWAPIITAVYHVSMGAMEGLSYNDTVERLKELYWPTLKACWMIWPAIMVVNFKLIPVAHQLNFCLAVSLVWATILSVIRAPDVSTSSKLEETEPTDIIPLSNCSFEAAQR